MEAEAEKLSFKSARKEIAVTEKEIKKLVENFILRWYEWEKFGIEEIMSNLSPLTSDGLESKIADDLAKEEKTSKNQASSQYVGKIIITIDEADYIVGSFVKILRIHNKWTSATSDIPIEKILLLSEEENPLGLYNYGVVSYDSR